MNIWTILLLSSTVVTSHADETNLNLRGGDIRNNSLPTEERALSDTCVTRSDYIGCYEDRNNNRAMSHQIDGRGYTARECETKCAEEGYLYFARQWRGQVSILKLSLFVDVSAAGFIFVLCWLILINIILLLIYFPLFPCNHIIT